MPLSSGGVGLKGLRRVSNKVSNRSWAPPTTSKYSLSIPTVNVKSLGGVVNLESMTQT